MADSYWIWHADRYVFPSSVQSPPEAFFSFLLFPSSPTHKLTTLQADANNKRAVADVKGPQLVRLRLAFPNTLDLPDGDPRLPLDIHRPLPSAGPRTLTAYCLRHAANHPSQRFHGSASPVSSTGGSRTSLRETPPVFPSGVCLATPNANGGAVARRSRLAGSHRRGALCGSEAVVISPRLRGLSSGACAATMNAGKRPDHSCAYQ